MQGSRQSAAKPRPEPGQSHVAFGDDNLRAETETEAETGLRARELELAGCGGDACCLVWYSVFKFGAIACPVVNVLQTH